MSEPNRQKQSFRTFSGNGSGLLTMKSLSATALSLGAMANFSGSGTLQYLTHTSVLGGLRDISLNPPAMPPGASPMPAAFNTEVAYKVQTMLGN